MKTNRLIFLISNAISLLAHMPRILFLINGKPEVNVSEIFNVTAGDTFTRVVLLFCFSFVILKFNLHWIDKFTRKYQIFYKVGINIGVYILFMFLFYIIDLYVYDIFNHLLNPKVNGFVYIFFLLLLILISLAFRLIEKSKKDSVEKEILIQKNLQNELDALRNQINPHFLFNSLNTLSLLVREDQKAAGRFINKLSFLYRYILQSQEKELVTVKEELKVLDSYVHLIVQRYEENFKVEISISEQMLSRQIPVLALQILMENVVKHNEISNKKPMLVEVFEEEDWIVVKNKFQIRSGPIESTHTGLKNLNTRVKIRMNKEIKIIREQDYFTVKTPTQ